MLCVVARLMVSGLLVTIRTNLTSAQLGPAPHTTPDIAPQRSDRRSCTLQTFIFKYFYHYSSNIFMQYNILIVLKHAIRKISSACRSLDNANGKDAMVDGWINHSSAFCTYMMYYEYNFNFVCNMIFCKSV